MAELLFEANMLGGLRHPNVVWVYGLCLPPLGERLGALGGALPKGKGIDAVQVATDFHNRWVLSTCRHNPEPRRVAMWGGAARRRRAGYCVRMGTARHAPADWGLAGCAAHAGAVACMGTS